MRQRRSLAQRCIANIARQRPTRRQWGSIAILAAERAGLEGADVRSLRVNLANQWAVAAEEPKGRRRGR
jgi:hypothetical protein